MKDKYKAIQHQDLNTLVCDNPNCNFTYENVENIAMKDLIDVPCPECQENLLTDVDYEHHVKLMKMIERINIAFYPLMVIKNLFSKSELKGETYAYHHHAGKTTVVKDDGK